MVRRRSLGRRARSAHDGERTDERLRAARRGRHATDNRGSVQGQGVLRRAHLQQPSACLRNGAGDDRRSTRRTTCIENARRMGARDEAAARANSRRSTPSSAPSARSASSASSSWCAIGESMEPLAPFNGTSDAMKRARSVLPRRGPLHLRAVEHVLHEPAAEHHGGRAAARLRHHRPGPVPLERTLSHRHRATDNTDNPDCCI